MQSSNFSQQIVQNKKFYMPSLVVPRKKKQELNKVQLKITLTWNVLDEQHETIPITLELVIHISPKSKNSKVERVWILSFDSMACPHPYRKKKRQIMHHIYQSNMLFIRNRQTNNQDPNHVNTNEKHNMHFHNFDDRKREKQR